RGGERCALRDPAAVLLALLGRGLFLLLRGCSRLGGLLGRWGRLRLLAVRGGALAVAAAAAAAASLRLGGRLGGLGSRVRYRLGQRGFFGSGSLLGRLLILRCPASEPWQCHSGLLAG